MACASITPSEELYPHLAATVNVNENLHGTLASGRARVWDATTDTKLGGVRGFSYREFFQVLQEAGDAPDTVAYLEAHDFHKMS